MDTFDILRTFPTNPNKLAYQQLNGILKSALGSIGHKISIVNTADYQKNLGPTWITCMVFRSIQGTILLLQILYGVQKLQQIGWSFRFIRKPLRHYINHKLCYPPTIIRGSSADPPKFTSCNSNKYEHTTQTVAKATIRCFLNSGT